MFRWLRWDPRRLVERRSEISGYLFDYPVYEPPHRQGPNFLRKIASEDTNEHQRSTQEFIGRGKESLTHLKAHSEQRLAALQVFLSKLGYRADISDDGLSQVSAWCPGNYGALVANFRDNATRQAFFQMAPWTGKWRGLNVVFDLGIFLGECVIARNPKVHWECMHGSSEDGSAKSSNYWIKGFGSPRDSLDAPGYMYGLCANDEAMLRSPSFDRGLHVNVLTGIVRDRSTR